MNKVSVLNPGSATLIDLKVAEEKEAVEGKLYYISADNEASPVTDADAPEQEVKVFCLENRSDAELDKTPERKVSFLRRGLIKTNTYDENNKPVAGRTVYCSDDGLLTADDTTDEDIAECIQGELSENIVVDVFM